MQAEEIRSWREFDDAVAGANYEDGRGERAHPSLVFRGLARSTYTNRHSLSRLGDEYHELERHLIRNFRKYAHRERPGPTLWDWLSLAQHHGLPTRLLDWTFSPFVAAHFATATSPNEEAIVWAVDCRAAHELLPDDLLRSLKSEGATVFTTELLASHAATLEDLERICGEDPFVLFFEPPSLDDRIVNQSAVLSTLSEGKASMDDWIEKHREVCHAWRIPPAAKADIRQRLDQANITERVLMPGLDGLATWLRRYYAPRHGGVLGDGGAAMAGQPPTGTTQGEQGEQDEQDEQDEQPPAPTLA